MEASDLYGMALTFTPYIHKVVEIIHMVCIGRLIHHLATSTILVGPEFWELGKFWGHS